MSVIYPRTYRLISEELGAAYAKVRNAIYTDGALFDNSALGDTQDIASLQLDNADDNYDGSKTPDSLADLLPSSAGFSVWTASAGFTAPEGSIAKDLGIPLFTLVNSTISETNAKAIAGRLFGTYLRALNSHVVTRTSGISTIGGYYQTYAFIADTSTDLNYEDELNLFDSDPTSIGLGASPSYFTADFVELSAQIGVKIDSQFQA